jgi:hypothetical protein
MRRVLLSVCAGLVVILVFLLIHAGWHWVEVHTGTVNEAGPYYGFWSGFGSDLGEVTLITAVLASVFSFYRSHECHNEPCHWPAHHTTKNGHRLCKKCISLPNDKLVLHDIHPDHQ